MTRKQHLNIFLLSFPILLFSAPQKEFSGRIRQRDPFSWQEQKKKAPPVVTASVQKVEKPREMPWHVCGVSLSTEGQYALFSHNQETKVVRLHQELCMGWKVETITPQSVLLKHDAGECRELMV